MCRHALFPNGNHPNTRSAPKSPLAQLAFHHHSQLARFYHGGYIEIKHARSPCFGYASCSFSTSKILSAYTASLKGLSQTKWRWFEKPRLISHYAIYDKATQGLTDTLTLLWTLRGKYESLLKRYVFWALKTRFF
jgi:hypothetical protein